ncbi:glycosidase, putative, partial [Rhizoctonia solani AG-3 Rhs1AP]
MASASPNPSNWGTPTAAWPESSCNSSQFFGPQTIILDITLCGNFAGAAATFQATCSGVCTDLIKTPSNYNNAYFDINYLRVFSDGTSGSNSGPTLTGSTATSTLVSSTNSESRTNAAASILVLALGSIIAMAGFVY